VPRESSSGSIVDFELAPHTGAGGSASGHAAHAPSKLRSCADGRVWQALQHIVARVIVVCRLPGTILGRWENARSRGLARRWASPCCQETRRVTARKATIASIDPLEAIGPFCTGFIPDDWPTRPPGLKQSSRCPNPSHQARWGSSFQARGRGCAAELRAARHSAATPAGDESRPTTDGRLNLSVPASEYSCVLVRTRACQ